MLLNNEDVRIVEGITEDEGQDLVKRDSLDACIVFDVDFDEFSTLLEQREAWDYDMETYVKGLQLPTLTLFYEDLLKDEATFIQRVFAFLEVKPKPVQGVTLKNTKDNLRDVIHNFDELRARYADTRYEPMFDEVLV